MRNLECNSIDEVRKNIDSIDKQIVALIAQRGDFVKQAVKFKKSTQDVKAPVRVEQVISKVVSLADELDADKVVVEKVYRAMIDAFINAEMQEFGKVHSNNKKRQWQYDSNCVDWEELSNLYKIAPLGDKKAEDLKIVFANSRYKCFVYDEGKIVGVGRALADSLDASYICDVAVHPDFQGLGLGKEIVNKLIEFSKGYNKIILYANIGKEQFYAKLGFDKMNTAMAIFKNREKVLEMGLVGEMK